MPFYRIEWLDEARADVRALDQSRAMRIFDGVLHFAQTCMRIGLLAPMGLARTTSPP